MIQQNIDLKLPSSALTYYMVTLPLFPIILTAFLYFYPPTTQYSLFIGLALIVLIIVYSFAYVATFSYQITGDSITINSGVLFKSSKIVNFNDLQNTNVKMGPLLSMFGLASLEGFTSNPTQLIISSDSRGHTQTTQNPDIKVLLLREDAIELATIMRKGDIQKVQAVQVNT
jgi:membrane protein YdbS with pleckstrin-like domain